MIILLAVALLSDPRLRNPVNDHVPAETPRDSISRRIRDLESYLGRVRLEPVPKDVDKLYDSLSIDEKHLLASYYDRAIKDGLSESSAKARAAREFRKFRDVDVNAKMVAEAVYDSSRAEIAEEREKSPMNRSALLEAAKEKQRRIAAEQDALRREAIKADMLGSIERVRDGATGTKQVRWISKVTVANTSARMVWWYDLDEKDVITSSIHVALDYETNRISTPHDDDRTTATRFNGQSTDYPNERDLVRYDGKQWDRLVFTPKLDALKSWTDEKGVEFRFGKSNIYPTSDIREMGAKFLTQYEEEIKVLRNDLEDEFGELHFQIQRNSDGTSRVSWRPRLKKGENRFLFIWYDRDAQGKPTDSINIAIEYYPAIGEMHERTKTAESYWTSNDDNAEGGLPLKTSKDAIVRSGTEYQRITTTVPPLFLSLWAMSLKTNANSKLRLCGIEVPLSAWMRPEIREFLIQFKKDADTHQVKHEIKDKTLEYLHD